MNVPSSKELPVAVWLLLDALAAVWPLLHLRWPGSPALGYESVTFQNFLSGRRQEHGVWPTEKWLQTPLWVVP